MADGQSPIDWGAWVLEGLMVLGALVLALVLVEWVTGCAGTVTPHQVQESVASWDGTNQNSGFIGFTPDGSGILTSHARERYDALIAIYGSRFLPPLKADDGVVGTGTNTFVIDQEHLVDFATMNRWRKQGL